MQGLNDIKRETTGKFTQLISGFSCREEVTRTPDLCVPNAARCQLRHFPKSLNILFSSNSVDCNHIWKEPSVIKKGSLRKRTYCRDEMTRTSDPHVPNVVR